MSVKSVDTSSIQAPFFVTQVHYTPPPWFTIPPSPYQCCSLFREVLYCNHTTLDGGEGGILWRTVNVLEESLLWLEKCHFKSMCQLLLTLIVVIHIYFLIFNMSSEHLLCKFELRDCGRQYIYLFHLVTLVDPNISSFNRSSKRLTAEGTETKKFWVWTQ